MRLVFIFILLLAQQTFACDSCHTPPKKHISLTTCGQCHSRGCGTDGHCDEGNCFQCHKKTSEILIDCFVPHPDLRECIECH